MTDLAPVLFIPHGGGPLPLLGDPGHRELVEFLGGLSPRLPPVEAVVVVSAHWEAAEPAITAGSDPGLLYDYYGFPPESYTIDYPARGDPERARAAEALLLARGFAPRLDGARAFDHGVFVPLKLLYPDAALPVVQVSLLSSLDPAAHLEMGRALADLRARNVLVIGSGLSFHNLPAFRASPPGEADRANEAFEDWLVETCTDATLTSAERSSRLERWEDAPHARYCHPREEHLLPLHVCAGMSELAAEVVFHGRVMGKRTAAFLWR